MKINQILEGNRFDRRDAYQRDYDSSVSGMGRGADHRGLRQELAHERNNIQIAINGRPWKVVAGRGTADSAEERSNLENMKQWAERKSASSGKTWTVYLTGAEVSESQGMAEGWKGELAGGTIGGIAGNLAGSALGGPIGGIVGGAVGGAGGGIIGRELTKEEQLNEFAPVLAGVQLHW
jgi:hypothetical protein